MRPGYKKEDRRYKDIIRGIESLSSIRVVIVLSVYVDLHGY